MKILGDINEQNEININKSMDDLQFHWRMLFQYSPYNKSGSNTIRNAYAILQ